MSKMSDEKSDKVSSLKDQMPDSDSRNLRLYRKVSEIYTLENRIRRYENRLALEGLRLAGESKISVLIGDGPGDLVEISSLIHLAKDKFPSLYRKWAVSRQKYFKVIEELKKFVE